MTVGETLTVVGYGQSGGGGQFPSVRQTIDTTVEHIAPFTDVGAQVIVPTNTFELTANAVCHGDSGGSTFDKTTGALVGVNVAGGLTDGCSASNGSARVLSIAPFKALLLSGFQAAGHEPVLENGSAPSTPDGGVTGTTGGTATDGGTSSSKKKKSAAAPADSGGCSATPNGAGSPWLCLLAVAFVVMRRRNQAIT